jgi:hypothetical protein
MKSEIDTNNAEAVTKRRPLAFKYLTVPLVIFAFCAIVIYLASQLDIAPPIIVGPAMQPRSFPIFLMVLIALLNTVLIWQLARGQEMPRVSQPPATWISIVLMAVFYVLATYVDMFIALIVVMFIMTIVWGERRIWLAALVSVLTPVSIFLLFDLVLEIRFPRGILTNLYYG